MSAVVEAGSRISEAMKRQYHEEGFMVIEDAVPDEMLQMLREECGYFIGYQDGQMDAKGEEVRGITHRGKRYFISNQYRRSRRMWQFIYAPFMADICKAALGEDVYLFHEQWVVKGPEQGMKFAWHQDSGYVKFGDGSTYHRPYLSCWVPLDDVDEENGTVYVLPHEIGGTRDTIMEHAPEDGTNDLIGYTGDHPGIPVITKAGSVVAFSSYTFHRSGANTSPNMRRVYLAQYSSEPIIHSQSGKPWGQAVPFVKEGEIVYDRDADSGHGDA